MDMVDEHTKFFTQIQEYHKAIDLIAVKAMEAGDFEVALEANVVGLNVAKQVMAMRAALDVQEDIEEFQAAKKVKLS